jgi:hypothetical protein
MRLCGFDIGLNQPFFLIAGPCVIESEQLQMDTAGTLKDITDKALVAKGLYAAIDAELPNLPRNSKLIIISQASHERDSLHGRHPARWQMVDWLGGGSAGRELAGRDARGASLQPA